MSAEGHRLESARLQFYRKACRWILGATLFKAWLSRKTRRECVLPLATVPPVGQNSRLWFHAASVGELESLRTVILRWLCEGGEAIVTVFSDSAIHGVRSLADEAERATKGAGSRILYAGYSPWEGTWNEALDRLTPALFVTAKYEAWPELWAALGERGVPLMIVGAKERSSLRFVKRALGILKTELPALILLPLLESDRDGLRQGFPLARIKVTGDPRWDRVHERARRGNPRAQELIFAMAPLPRPWGVLGSVWQEDLDVFGHRLFQLSGSLWVVPHRVDEATIDAICAHLQRGFSSVLRTSRLDRSGDWANEAAARAVIVVDEMGFLSELYAAADWAFVGGGFGSGVHSTIEPAIQGIPLACGPSRAESFAEIGELESAGQLRIVRDMDSIADWLKAVGVLPHHESHETVTTADRSRWKDEAQRRLGATDRVFLEIRALVK